MHCFSFSGWVYFKFLVVSSDYLAVIKRLKKPAESDLNSDYVDKIIRSQGDTLPFFLSVVKRSSLLATDRSCRDENRDPDIIFLDRLKI